MKKSKILIPLFAAAALLLGSCNKEMENPVEKRVKVRIGASTEVPTGETKSQLSDLGVFTWNEDDAIQVFTGNGFTYFEHDENSLIEDNITVFEGWLTGDNAFLSEIAVFPPNVNNRPTFTDGDPINDSGTLRVTLPAEIPWVQGQANNWQLATHIEGTVLQFYNIAAMFKVKLRNLPAATRKITFKTGKRITGNFTMSGIRNQESYLSANLPYIAAGESTTEGVTFTFDAPNTEEMVFYVPVPVGEYSGFSFSVKDANDVELSHFNGHSTQDMTRGRLRIMPTLTLATISGGGEVGKVNVIVPAGTNGDFFLPNTASNLEVHVEENSGNTINLKYYEGNDAVSSHPEEISLLIEGNVGTLDINLPDSHVELNGTTTGTNVFTLDNVNSTTSLSTLVIGNTNANIKIGKDDVANSGLTVKGGSLQLQTVPVKKLVVDIPDSQVNNTEEKVTISISSAIHSLEVVNAATQNLPDKVFVTLEEGSSVEAAITVPEVNCNLYIAPGATATTVETSAAENTISGTVTTLTATPQNNQTELNVTVTEGAAVTTVEATGTGTNVDILSGSEVNSVSANNSANVNIANGVDQIGTSTAPPVTNNNNESGTITLGVAATIGSTPYSSLAAAYTAANNGDIITLLVDCILSESFVNEKNITIDLGDYSISGNVGAGTAAQSAEGKLIYNRGTLTINSANNKGRIWNTCIDAQGRDAIYNAEGATIIINGGIFGDSDTDMTNGNNVNRGAGIRNFGTATLNGGKFTAGDNYLNSGWAYAIINGDEHETCVLTINDGVVVYGQNNGNIAGNAGTININGGEFNITGSKSHYNVYAYNAVVNVIGGTYTKTNGASGSKYMFCVDVDNDNASNPGKINVSGGNFTQNNTTTTLASSAANIALTGGTFNVDPSDFVADGYSAVKSGTLWTVGKASNGVSNLAELQNAIAYNTTPIYYVGEPITEAFTLSPAVPTVINGLKVNHTPSTSGTTTLTLNGNITLSDANIVTSAYCGVEIKANKVVTLENCVVNGSSASAENSRAININGGCTVTIDGCTVNGPASAGYSRCVNLLGDGATVTINGGTKLSVSHYAINLPSAAVNNVVNVENSTVNTGWAIVNIWKTGNTINFDNCVLNSLNDKPYNADGWNNFAAFVFNEGCTYNEVNVNNSQVSVRATTGNKQQLASFRDKNNTLNFKNNTSIIGETTNSNGSPVSVYSTALPFTLDFDDTVSLIWDGVDLMHEAAIGNTAYGTLAEAFEAAEDGNTITVLSDIDIPETITVAKNVTLDLNGKTLSNTVDLWNKANGTWSVFSVREGGNLTVTGNGTIDAKENDCYTFDVRDGGVLTIKNGTFTGNISCVYLINNPDTGVSTCNIEGGTFSLKQLQSGGDGYRFLLNCLDEDYANNYVRFNVTGGSFVNFNPANNLAEGAGTNFVADGYTVTQNGTIWTVEEAEGVARIGSEYYPSLAAAVAAAESGATIVLVADDDISLTTGGEITINKPLTITGAVDALGAPKYTVYGQPTYKGTYNDVFISSTSGTVSISNIYFKNFSNEVATCDLGRAVLFVGSANQNVLIDNVYIDEINTEAIHINGGTFAISNCAIDCANDNTGAYTRGIYVMNDATGSITNTNISNVVSNGGFSTAAIELQGNGPIAISGCELNGDEVVNTVGIAAGTAQGLTPGSSSVTVTDCLITAYISIFGDGDSGAQISVNSGEYVGYLVQGNNGTGISITGGIFSDEPTSYVAEGCKIYVFTEGDYEGMYGVAAGNNPWGSIVTELTEEAGSW